MKGLRCKLKAMCDVVIEIGYDKKVKISKNDVVNCVISDFGIRLEYKKNHYTNLFSIASISESFIIYEGVD